MKKHLIPLLLSILSIGLFSTKAQEIVLPFRHYSTDEGLANSDVYDIIRDNKGFLWLATDNGLSHFDGLHFTNYFIENGLADNSLTALAQRGDTLYITCYRKGVQRLINGKFEKSLFQPLNSIAFLRTSADTVYAFRQANSNGKVHYALTNNKQKAYAENSILFSSNRSSKRPFYSLDLKTYDLYRNGIFYKHLPKSLIGEVLYGIDETPKGEILLGSKSKYFVLDKTNKLSLFNYQDISSIKKIDIILKDNAGRIWYRDQYGKALVEINGKRYSINKLLKIDENVAIRAIFYDEIEQKIWVATGGKGIFCIYNDFINNYLFDTEEIDTKILTLETDADNRLWLGNANGFYVFEEQKIRPYNNSNGWRYCMDITKAYGKILVNYQGYSADNKQVLKHPQLTTQKVMGQEVISTNLSLLLNENLILNRELYMMQKEGKKWVYRGTKIPVTGMLQENSSINRHKNLTTIFINPLKRGNRRILSMYHRNDTTWIGTNKGLSWIVWQKGFVNGKEYEPFPKSALMMGVITKIKGDKNGRIFILCDKGLGIWQNKRLIFEGSVYRNQDVAGANSIAFDSKNQLWLGTKKGIIFFAKEGILVFNKKNGLNSSEINALKYDAINNVMWAGTNDGFTKIDVSALEKYDFAPPKLQILEVSTLLGKHFASNKNLNFSSDENYLKFHLSASDYESPETIQYQYTLDGSGWNATDSALILPAVSFGKHTILFRAKNDNSDWGKPQKLSFEIEVPFYQNWLFWVATSLVFMALFYWWIEHNHRKEQNQIQLKRQIAELKQQGMASMMNPHFIFNALNSIQYYINANNLLLVNEYLSKFGKLIRLNLESSFNNSVSLKNELAFIELYLSLEKLRFGSKFNYQIQVAPNIETDKILMPPMFIQPFVENAIIHGIIPSNLQGEIELKIYLKPNDILEIIIKDNGIGIESSSKKAKSDHTSRSMEIIKQRIRLMNDENKGNSIVFKENNDSSGSMVIINVKIVILNLQN